jgi:hypothetical protein
MENLLEKGHSSIIPQLHSIQAVETPFPTVHLDLHLCYPKTNLFLTIPKDFPLPVAHMIIPFP